MNATPAPTYRPVILPELHRIQQEYGYLDRAAMAEFARRAGVPLHQVHAVASFFPHFRMTPPPRVSLHVCRDMACHMAGSGEILRELAGLAEPGRVGVSGVSCLGRCDRAPAACVALHARHAGNGSAADPHPGELFYHGRSAAELREIVRKSLAGGGASVPPVGSGGGTGHVSDHGTRDGTGGTDVPPPDVDEAQPYPGSSWQIDPYAGRTCDYPAAKRAAELRGASIARAAVLLREQSGWSTEDAEQFRV